VGGGGGGKQDLPLEGEGMVCVGRVSKQELSRNFILQIEHVRFLDHVRFSSIAIFNY